MVDRVTETRWQGGWLVKKGVFDYVMKPRWHGGMVARYEERGTKKVLKKKY